MHGVWIIIGIIYIMGRDGHGPKWLWAEMAMEHPLTAGFYTFRKAKVKVDKILPDKQISFFFKCYLLSLSMRLKIGNAVWSYDNIFVSIYRINYEMTRPCL